MQIETHRPTDASLIKVVNDLKTDVQKLAIGYKCHAFSTKLVTTVVTCITCMLTMGVHCIDCAPLCRFDARIAGLTEVIKQTLLESQVCFLCREKCDLEVFLTENVERWLLNLACCWHRLSSRKTGLAIQQA